MPDISMCQDRDCPKRQSCYRFRAVPDGMRQSYMLVKYENGCEYFLKIWPESNLQEKQDD